MNVEIGAEAALIPVKEYINGIFVTVCALCSHQQHRVRSAGVRALGGLVLAAGGEALEYTVSHLAQRVFDARPENMYNI
jgi:hypothetical protein